MRMDESWCGSGTYIYEWVSSYNTCNRGCVHAAGWTDAMPPQRTCVYAVLAGIDCATVPMQWGQCDAMPLPGREGRRETERRRGGNWEFGYFQVCVFVCEREERKTEKCSEMRYDVMPLPSTCVYAVCSPCWNWVHPDTMLCSTLLCDGMRLPIACVCASALLDASTDSMCMCKCASGWSSKQNKTKSKYT